MKIEVDIPRSTQATVMAIVLRAAKEEKTKEITDLLNEMFDSEEPYVIDIDIFDEESKEALRSLILSLTMFTLAQYGGRIDVLNDAVN